VRNLVTAVVIGGSILLAKDACAQSSPEILRPALEQPASASRGAPTHALELGAAIGYAGAFGGFRRHERVQDVSGTGLGAVISIGARVTPFLSILWQGRYEEFDVSQSLTNGTGVRGVDSAVDFVGHLRASSRLDPWVSLGAGYHVVWASKTDRTQTETFEGIDLARLRVGIDLRTSHLLAIGPVFGIDLDTFPWHTLGDATSRIHDESLATYLFAGVQGRFDVGAYEKVKIKTASR
jgi:hypothetical protein